MDETIGYDFNLADDVEIPAEYKCLICTFYIRNAVELPCSHAFCNLCLDKWEQRRYGRDENSASHNCLLCDKEYQAGDKHPSRFIDRIITTSLDVPCRQNNVGCRWNGKIIDYQKDHENVCQFLQIPCTMEGCEVIKQRKLLEKHHVECEYRLVECNFCGIIQRHKDVKEHTEVCPEMIIKCFNPRCEIDVKRNQMDDHQQTECLFQIVPCKYQQVGCNMQIARKYLKDHDNKFNTMHTELMLKGLMETSVKLNQTRQELDQTKVKLAKTERKLDENRGNVEGFVFNVCSILQNITAANEDSKYSREASQQQNPIKRMMGFSDTLLQKPIKKIMGFSDTLPLLSKIDYQEFLKHNVFSIINTNKNLFNFQLIEKMHSDKLFAYNYKHIFKYLLETMELGERYVHLNHFYFKLPIMNQPKNGKIKITVSKAIDLVKFKQEHKDTLVFENLILALGYKENNEYQLFFNRSTMGPIVEENIWLYGVKNEKDGMDLKDGYINNEEWKKHITESYEFLIRVESKFLLQDNPNPNPPLGRGIYNYSY